MESQLQIDLNQNISWLNSMLQMFVYMFELEVAWFKQPVVLAWIKLNTYFSTWQAEVWDLDSVSDLLLSWDTIIGHWCLNLMYQKDAVWSMKQNI